jgi:hypothetical protein
MKKICSKCKDEKDISCFAKKYKTSDGTQKYSSICKKCVNENDTIRRESNEYKKKKKEYDNLYYEQNQEKIKNRKKEYHIENREEILEKKGIYRSVPENRERSKKYIKKYKVENKEKYYAYRKRNPHIIAWRNMLYRTLIHLGTKKEGDTKEMLGYSAVQLKHHIEKQFLEGMSWENHGEWEIDHIKPLTKFDEFSLVSEVNALSNLQPLWKDDNREKYNNYFDI